MVKRLFDILVSGAGLIVLIPVFFCLAILGSFFFGGRPFFRQARPGSGGRAFQIFKFRSMTEAFSREEAPLPDSDRLNSYGRLLRKTSLDELPELWNVLVGDMSLVGPRPLLMDYLPLYSDEQKRRHEVRPGITGWSQINGRNSLDWEERLAKDVWYVDNRSFFLDLKILCRTVGTVFQRKGISQRGQATMERFRGTSR